MRDALELTLGVIEYDRTRPLLNGETIVDGITLKASPVIPGKPCRLPLYEEFDIAEMSFSWYVMARCRKTPIIALPIFPQRMFVHSYMFCSDSSGIRGPEDLKGKKICIGGSYRATIGLWSRGILGEHHGIFPQDVTWVCAKREGGFNPPDGVNVIVREEDGESLLLNGEVDALINLEFIARSFRDGDPRIRRLFGNCREAIFQYFTKTGIFPATHTVVVRESLVERHPWIVKRLVQAFSEADMLCRKSYEYVKRFSFPTAALILEEEEQTFGKNPWIHGLGANRAMIEKFVEYANDQGYINRRPSPDDLFAREDG